VQRGLELDLVCFNLFRNPDRSSQLLSGLDCLQNALTAMCLIGLIRFRKFASESKDNGSLNIVQSLYECAGYVSALIQGRSYYVPSDVAQPEQNRGSSVVGVELRQVK